ncbi:hypothetical protein N7509_003410 [Penicillium cosmopolitanum]|uniref:beta-glucosidase n=1 Tax=Penicillium cosmopolitanum TaxID=1131564 RepID=A0A9W9W4V7_9EURO|nr:uncharacterized protein N7509_003410 [Penicillium cosmopolitanum]KAJ5403539.1 hypothetical protein N7509_003410 [Penicillium cosmopolitanum]
MLSQGKIGVALAILSMCGLGHTEENITSDTHFYGQSEPVYPSRQGDRDWADAYAKAAELVAQLTLEEKNNLTYGIATTENGCSGNIPAIPRVGFTGMCLQDAGQGVRFTDFVNSYPSGIHVGASWNKTLAHDRAWHMGGEFRKKGVQVALGPVVGPLGRVVTGGRNWEGPSNDPYLGGVMGAESVRGLQDQGVISSVKHFIANEQELYRNPTLDAENRTVQSISSNIDDKTMHELYLWPFQDALKAGAANIMCSYNRINNSYASQNSKTLNGILKTELGFEGFVVTDWDAQHAGVAAANAGLDMAMPDGQTFWGNNFTEAFKNGSVSEARLNDMATRIIASWYKLGQDESSYPKPGVGMPYNLSEPHDIVNALTADARPVLFEGAVEGHVLVKNVNKSLPLRSPKLLSVFGYDAKAPDAYMPNGQSILTNAWAIGFEPAISHFSELSFAATVINAPYYSQVAFNGTLSVGGGSGASAGPYLSAPLDALQQRAYEDGTASDACLVFINAFATEGSDRAGAYDDYSDGLINQVATTCANTIVVIHNAGTRLVDQFADHPNVTAIIFAHLPGQDSGRALVSLLYGDENFSGKLPYSVAKNESDYENFFHVGATTPYGLFPQDDFEEGVLTDYRYFDAKNITLRYEFGFGLSYTSFEFSGLEISSVEDGIAAYPSGAIEQGGAIDLWDIVATVKATVQNTGDRTGAEVAQIYIGIPNGPVKQLRGFDKVKIPAGKSVQVSFPLTRRDLSSWDVVAQKWQLQSGSYDVFVGSSSRNLPLRSTLNIVADDK